MIWRVSLFFSSPIDTAPDVLFQIWSVLVLGLLVAKSKPTIPLLVFATDSPPSATELSTSAFESFPIAKAYFTLVL